MGLSIAKNLDNREQYLKRLKIELDRVAKEARPLEEMDKRLKLMQSRWQKGPSSLGVLYELHQVMPREVTLISLNYEEDRQIILHGQSPRLDSVFLLVSKLEDSGVFKGFNIKVRYATKKKTRTAEFIDFEIVCSKQ